MTPQDDANMRALLKKADKLERCGRFHEALPMFNGVIEVEPNNIRAYRGRALTFDGLHLHKEPGSPEGAIRDATKVLQHDPDDISMHRILGTAFAALGRYDEAIEEFTRCIALNTFPDRSLYHKLRGQVFCQARKYVEAIADFTKAIEMSPKPPPIDIYPLRAQAYEHVGDFDNAIQDHTRSIRIEPDQPLWYEARAKVYIAKGDPKRAAKDYRKVLQLDPGHAGAGEFLRNVE